MNRAALHLGAIAMLSWGSQRILGRGKRFIAHGETAERRGPVKFETSMYKVQQRFGEEIMRQTLDAAKPGGSAPQGLAGTPALAELQAKLHNCGFMETLQGRPRLQPRPSRGRPARPRPSQTEIRLQQAMPSQWGWSLLALLRSAQCWLAPFCC
ncbi:unnamed protein product [Effrenium voratum]|nr:unnamed protein product [Effrenium voratum]